MPEVIMNGSRIVAIARELLSSMLRRRNCSYIRKIEQLTSDLMPYSLRGFRILTDAVERGILR